MYLDETGKYKNDSLYRLIIDLFPRPLSGKRGLSSSFRCSCYRNCNWIYRWGTFATVFISKSPL